MKWPDGHPDAIAWSNVPSNGIPPQIVRRMPPNMKKKMFDPRTLSRKCNASLQGKMPPTPPQGQRGNAPVTTGIPTSVGTGHGSNSDTLQRSDLGIEKLFCFFGSRLDGCLERHDGSGIQNMSILGPRIVSVIRQVKRKELTLAPYTTTPAQTAPADRLAPAATRCQ